MGYISKLVALHLEFSKKSASYFKAQETLKPNLRIELDAMKSILQRDIKLYKTLEGADLNALTAAMKANCAYVESIN